MGSLHDLQSVYYTMGFFQFAMLRVEFTAVVTGWTPIQVCKFDHKSTKEAVPTGVTDAHLETTRDWMFACSKSWTLIKLLLWRLLCLRVYKNILKAHCHDPLLFTRIAYCDTHLAKVEDVQSSTCPPWSGFALKAFSSFRAKTLHPIHGFKTWNSYKTFIYNKYIYIYIWVNII